MKSNLRLKQMTLASTTLPYMTKVSISYKNYEIKQIQKDILMI